MRAQFRPQAENFVKVRLALEKVAELENIEVTEEEIEAEYNRLAEMYSMEVDKIKEAIDAKDLAMDLNIQAALKFVKDNADVTVKVAE